MNKKILLLVSIVICISSIIFNNGCKSGGLSVDDIVSMTVSAPPHQGEKDTFNSSDDREEIEDFLSAFNSAKRFTDDAGTTSPVSVILKLRNGRLIYVWGGGEGYQTVGIYRGNMKNQIKQYNVKGEELHLRLKNYRKKYDRGSYESEKQEEERFNVLSFKKVKSDKVFSRLNSISAPSLADRNYATDIASKFGIGGPAKKSGEDFFAGDPDGKSIIIRKDGSFIYLDTRLMDAETKFNRKWTEAHYKKIGDRILKEIGLFDSGLIFDGASVGSIVSSYDGNKQIDKPMTVSLHYHGYTLKWLFFKDKLVKINMSVKGDGQLANFSMNFKYKEV